MSFKVGQLAAFLDKIANSNTENFWYELLRVNNVQDGDLLNTMLEGKKDIVWYPGSADDFFPIYVDEDYISNDNLFVYTDCQYNFEQDEVFYKENGVVQFNKKANGSLLDEYRNKTHINDCFDIYIPDAFGNKLINGKALSVNYSDKNYTIIYLVMDMMVFFQEIVERYSVNIKCLIYKQMNIYRLLYAYDSNKFKMPEYILADRMEVKMEELTSLDNFNASTVVKKTELIKQIYGIDAEDVINLYKGIESESSIKIYSMNEAFDFMEEFSDKYNGALKEIIKKINEEKENYYLAIWISGMCYKHNIKVEVEADVYYINGDPDVGYEGEPEYVLANSSNDYFVYDCWGCILYSCYEECYVYKEKAIEMISWPDLYDLNITEYIDNCNADELLQIVNAIEELKFMVNQTFV